MTKSLLQFEKDFIEYQLIIKSDYSVEYKLITLIDFWEDLKLLFNVDIYQSYIQIGKQDFHKYITEQNISDLTIDELKRLLNISKIFQISDNCEIIIKRILTLYCYVGEFQQAIDIFNINYKEKFDLSELGLEKNCFPYEQLEKLCELFSKNNTKAEQIFTKVLNKWRSKSETLSNKIVNCVLVEKTDLNQRGKLCKLECDVDFLGKRVTEDKISLNDELKSKDDPFVGVIYNSIKSVKLLFNRFQNKHLHSHLKIINNNQRVTGDSIGLATATVMYANLIKDEVQRYERFIAGDAALTGSLDSEGNVLPISEETLSCKIKRIFFSHISYLVIPNENFELSKQILNELKKLYPCRDLILFPVLAFSDVLRNKNIVCSEKVCIGEFAAKTIVKYSRMTKVQVPLLICLVLLLSAMIFPKWMPWFDWHIADIEVKGNRFRTMNASGQTIWWSESMFGELQENNETVEIYKKNCYYAFDFEQDGKEELFFVPSKIHREGIIQFYNDQGKMIWEELGYDTLKLSKQITSEINTKPCVLPLGDSDSGYIITESWLLSEPLCWQQFQLYDKNGKVGGVYTFQGVVHLFEPIAQIVDIDKDSVVELLVGGTSINDNGSGVMVLNPFNLSGVAPPYNKNFFESGLNKGSQKFYISIPKTPLCYNKNIKNDVRYLMYNDLTGKIDVQVYEAINLFLNGKVYGTDDKLPIMLYEFDENLIPTRTRLADQGYSIYEYLWSELGNKDPIDFDKLFDSLMSEVVVYHGDSIVHHTAAGIDFYNSK